MAGPPRKQFLYTDEELIAAVRASISVRAICRALFANETNSARRDVIRRIKELNIDTSHLLGQAHARGTWQSRHKPPESRIPIE
jgi:hypothetical protein